MVLLKKPLIQNFGGFFLGLMVFFTILFLIPSNIMPEKAQHMAAIALLMAIWWITEAIPIPVTALLPILMFPLLKIMKTNEVTINYGHHLVFLFLGGFIIALTIERWNLHKRIALVIINLIGSNATLLDNSRIGNFCIIGAGCLISQGMKVPDYSFVIGVPARIEKQIKPEQLKRWQGGTQSYMELLKRYKKQGL